MDTYQLAGARQVKAQVKLQFTNLQGNNVTCVRTIEVTMRADKAMTAKTLDSSMELLNANGEVCVSHPDAWVPAGRKKTGPRGVPRGRTGPKRVHADARVPTGPIPAPGSRPRPPPPPPRPFFPFPLSSP